MRKLIIFSCLIILTEHLKNFILTIKLMHLFTLIIIIIFLFSFNLFNSHCFCVLSSLFYFMLILLYEKLLFLIKYYYYSLILYIL